MVKKNIYNKIMFKKQQLFFLILVSCVSVAHVMLDLNRSAGEDFKANVS